MIAARMARTDQFIGGGHQTAALQSVDHSVLGPCRPLLRRGVALPLLEWDRRGAGAEALVAQLSRLGSHTQARAVLNAWIAGEQQYRPSAPRQGAALARDVDIDLVRQRPPTMRCPPTGGPKPQGEK